MVESKKSYPPGFVPFANRQGLWDDLSPVQQYEGETGLAPIAAIHYQPDYEEVMSYFRAILKKQEVSERAYELVKEVIKFSPGHYTAWFYMRKLIDEMQLPLEDAMAWV